MIRYVAVETRQREGRIRFKQKSCRINPAAFLFKSLFWSRNTKSSPLPCLHGNMQDMQLFFNSCYVYLMEFDEIYFYTATINNWIPLLQADKFKHIVLNSLIHLVKQKKIGIYGFVIMPNHIHLIWSGSKMNGKEKPFASFMKFTAHKFLDELRTTDEPLLAKFKTDLRNRNYLFWQTNSLPIKILDRKMLE